MANFRPLQPAPMDQEQPSLPQGRPLLTQKPKRTVTLGACVACRKRKSKCDGTRPVCTCCAQKDTDCVYELGPNEKPSQAMKRKNEEMQGSNGGLSAHQDGCIRSNSTQRIQELADFVRHGDPQIGSPFAPVVRYSSDPLTLPPLRMALGSPNSDPSILSNSYPILAGFPSVPSEEPTSQRRRHDSDADVSARSDSQGPLPRPISIQSILYQPGAADSQSPLDPRLYTANNWTNVTDDTTLVSHLMSAWHRFEYRYYHFLDWENFLQDMSTGRTDFCSRLLVNALLASASFQSSMVKNRSKPFSDNSITIFYKEARRLWEEEEGQDSLTKLQAALCLFLVLGKHGRDKVGYTLLVEACRIARDLGLFRLSSTAQKPAGVSIERWEKSRAVTAWAVFNFQLTMSFTYSFPALIKSQPPLLIPYYDTPDSEALFRSECARHVILLDCASTLRMTDEYDSDLPPKPEQVEVLYMRLKSWYDDRPCSTNPNTNSTPENLLAAMVYHATIIRLVQPFLSRESNLERVRSYQERARALASASMKDIRQLLALHEVRHGWSNTIPYVLHPVMVLSFASLEEIALDGKPHRASEPNEAYQGLLTCFRALSALSNSVFYAQPLFRLLTQTCQALEIELPSEVLSMQDRLQSDEWTKNAASLVSSQYVADLRKLATDIDNSRMDSIISQWDESLSIGDQSSRGGSLATSDSAHDSVGSVKVEDQ